MKCQLSPKSAGTLADRVRPLLHYSKAIDRFWRHGASLSPSAMILESEATIGAALGSALVQAEAALEKAEAALEKAGREDPPEFRKAVEHQQASIHQARQEDLDELLSVISVLLGLLASDDRSSSTDIAIIEARALTINALDKVQGLQP